MGFGEIFTPGMRVGCVLVLTLVVCKILGERQEIKETFESGRHRYFYPCWFFCVFLVFFFFPQTWLAARNWNKSEKQGLSIWAFILDVILQCADDVLAQKRHLKYAEVPLSPVVVLHMLKVKCLLKCSLQLGLDFYCQSWMARSLLLHHFCSGRLDNLALSM